jgi:putative MFS transporter
VATGISFHRPLAFWSGATLVTLGVFAHIPDYLAAGSMNFHMAGMPMSRVMIAGMFFVAAGMVLATWGLLAPATSAARRPTTYHLRAIDDAALTGAHWGLLFVLGVALMGLAAGGMLPIVYALMAESVPAKSRGWLVVVHGGMGTVGGTLAVAGFAALLEPSWSWRILWLLNLPTGILMLILNRWIPESPRFLLDRGRIDEARAVMARYGVAIEVGPPSTTELQMRKPPLQWNEVRALFQRPFLTQTTVVLAYGLAWGIVNWGFISFLPTFLRGAGFSAATSSYLLFLSAFVAIPGTVLVAYAYGMWSSRRSMMLFAAA